MNEAMRDSAEGQPVEASGAPVLGGVQEQLQRTLERAAQAHVQAAVIVLEINPDYARRPSQRVHEVLAHWQRRRAECIHLGGLGPNRFVVVIAPLGSPGRAQAIAEELTRVLDPRICPLLRRALPYAWSGFSLYPDDGGDPATLVLGAERAMERIRAAGTRSGQFIFPRRRDATLRVRTG